MSKKIVLILLLICTAASTLIAEDPREQNYHVPALSPKHKEKPQVTGWAKKRIDEKINRGMLAISNKEGKVYLGWRLLKSDTKGTAFNVYRSIEGGNPARLNREPVVATTDFIDKKPVMGRESIYWVRPVINGKELGPSEKALLMANAKDKPYHASIKFQGDYRPQRIAVADLNGDGSYDFVIKQPNRPKPPPLFKTRAGKPHDVQKYNGLKTS